ncbi:hypothetical protein, partial [Microcoleus sp. AT3-D2]|uniref:hypothetical protein n=1 Tax=Microcoleus sp. AT3-D2 TaxID=2818612 RepID=UPI002FD44BE6
KKEEGRRKKEEGRRKKEEGRRKKEEEEEGRRNLQLMFQQLRTSSSSGVVAIEGRSLKKKNRSSIER